MGKRPFFSVIVPAYNAEGHIRKGLQSILAQECHDYELIVVCDSCADRTERIAQEYGAITCNVAFGSDGLTRDRGIEMATGDWCLFMDDDDWFLHEYCFQQLYELAGKHDEDVLAFGYIWAGKGYMKPNKEKFLDPDSHVWAKCWRREAIGNARFGNVRFCSDTYFMRRMKKNIKKAVIWDMPIYYYNFMREGSQTDKLISGEIHKGPIAR